IHYPDEVRQVKDLPNLPEKNEVIKKELDTAKMLIEQLTTTFNPEKYVDNYRTALLDLIEEKKNKDTVVVSEKSMPDNVTNLMDARQASLDRAKKSKPKATRKPKVVKKVAK